MEKVVSLAKRRGFIFPGSEIYGGLANSWDYGPLGVELKNNIMQLWWKRFAQSRDDMVGIDAALIMKPEVWKASGHLKNFSDPLVECKKCHERFRPDNTPGFSTILKNDGLREFMPSDKATCPGCGGNKFATAKEFSLMFKTFVGPAEEQANVAYFRPEIAQAMFVNFKNVLDTTRRTLPFGIASQGKAFRNEITPGNFIFRTREFNLMELEYFIHEMEWEQWFEYWRKEMRGWISEVGIDTKKVREVDIPEGERAHYSKLTVDFEFEYPFGQKELYGLAYRTDFDLRNHFKEAPYKDPKSGAAFYPHVIEPTFGADRTVLAVLLSSYVEEGERVCLKLAPKLAPYKAAVFPLLANKPDLVKMASDIYDELRRTFSVA